MCFVGIIECLFVNLFAPNKLHMSVNNFIRLANEISNVDDLKFSMVN